MKQKHHESVSQQGKPKYPDTRVLVPAEPAGEYRLLPETEVLPDTKATWAGWLGGVGGRGCRGSEEGVMCPSGMTFCRLACG